MAAKAILLDLDGTIWESYSWYARILSEAAGGSIAKRIQQLRAGRSVVSLCNACGLSSSTFQSLCVASAKSLPLYPGVIECLEELIRRRHPLGVVTSLSGRIAEPLLQALGLTEKFGVVVHAGNCRYRKPSPEPILMALQAVRGEPSISWYVGDKNSDADSAGAAGVRFAWASYGYGDDCPDGAVILKYFRDVLDL